MYKLKKVFEKNLDKLDWNNLSLNPNAIDLLEKNLDKINWLFLSKNLNAIHFLEKNLDKIYWDFYHQIQMPLIY